MTAVVEWPRIRARSEVEYRLARGQRERLTPLVGELRWRGYAAELVRFGDPLRFAVRVPHPRRGELPVELLRDAVLWLWCRRDRDGQWWFEYPWGDRITAPADVPGAADFVAELLGPPQPGPAGGGL